MKKVLMGSLACVVIALLTAICLLEYSKKNTMLFENDFVCSYADYCVACNNVCKKYDISDINSGKYIPDTIEIKKELDSCIYKIVVTSFDSIFTEYGESYFKHIKGFKSKDEYYRKLTDEGVEKIMSRIRHGIKYRKIMNPTYEDKIETLIKLELID
jgi:hypothetical protein